tara:strand:- start:627 stop:1418 length:792 start_codon:yes stop_codon:yes gene_type:complete
MENTQTKKVAIKKKKALIAKTYRLTRNAAPICYMLSSHNTKRSPLQYFDDQTGVNRSLRYARNQKSPFEDEQDGNAILEPIIFEDGLLHVAKTNQVLQEFLYYHPSNGMVFEEVDKSKEAAEELEMEDVVLDAQVIARDLTVDKLSTLCRVLMGAATDKLTTTELKRDILVFARTNPIDFLDALDDPMLEVQDNVVQFFSNSILSLRNKQRDVYFNLPKNKKKMLTVPFGEDPADIVASYMQTDEGIETYKVLLKALKKDKKD